MPPIPKATLDESFAEGLKCAICGHDSLQVFHVANLPDYVGCEQCNSAFVVEEGGQRVMYGMIDPAYPETRIFALRQWIHPDEVEAKAISEHPPTIPVESTVPPFPEEPLPQAPPSPEEIPPPVEYAPPEEIPAPIDYASHEESLPGPEELLDLEAVEESEERSPTLKLEYKEIEEPVEAPIIPSLSDLQEPAIPEPELEIEEEPTEESHFTPRENDPPPGYRFRVVLQGTEANFPNNICAHCSSTHVRGRLAVVSSLPQGQEVGHRKVTTFNLPLCADCHKRAAVRSEAERNARLQTHLISALIALVSMVAALALGLKPLEEGPLGILILVILAVLGYTLPVIVLLNRIGPYPVSQDATYVRSTLLVPSEVQGLETAFEWRNKMYAERFHQANHETTIGQIIKVKDRTQAETLQSHS
ncbi:MAG TPA: hypothetical protein G4O11_10070 [Anaerolineae bacterium]|nr:hypothetical protein [Anaerolineae bacterium]